MIRPTDLAVWVVTCAGCGGEEYVLVHADSSAEDVEAQLRTDGWECGDEHRCMSCVSGTGLPAGAFGLPGMAS